ncbi:MAG: GH116 family glycosyl-hydrolase [Caldilineaceae bacterium]|nr:GH116 family glycosyl-hydrolase [Caldilineaceae bacterium]
MKSEPSSWPSLTRYEGPHLQEIAFPLGGIGTGSFCLGGRADFRDFELFNCPDKGCKPPYTFFAMRAQRPGEPAVTRILEGALQPPFRGGGFGAGVPLAGLPRMREVLLDACYPFARYTLSDPDVPLTVHLEAFNPLIPLDIDRSGLPVAILRYELVNPTDQPIQASVAGSLYNFIGYDASGRRGQWSSKPAEPGQLLGGNVNELRRVTTDGLPLQGLLMRSLRVAPGTPQDGTMALVAISGEATWRRSWGSRHWNRHILSFWEDFSEGGRLDDPFGAPPSPEREGQIGSLAAGTTVPPQGSASFTFLITWHFPHRTAAGCGWDTLDEEGGWVGNYYATQYTDAWDAAVQIAPQLDALETESLRFARALVASSLPQAVKEAALNNLSTLRSLTCFRTADGRFFAFEGTEDDRGSCFGSCTHVWNYEQATAFVFPALARSMRDSELKQGTLPSGMNCFRLHLPLGGEPWQFAAADGQMGVMMKCYREWQLSGDSEWLAQKWPTIRSLVGYAWLPGGWDADQDGVMEGVQHNTYDVEFFGPNPLSGIWYLGALRAAELMAGAVGDHEFSDTCRDLFRRGSAWIDGNLFNGEFYVQQVRTPSSLEDTLPELRAGMGETNLVDPDFQMGKGCLIDQLVGQYMAHVTGLGYLLSRDNVRTALRSLYCYNFRRDLGGHWNNMRTYALGDEAGLVMASWPGGDRPSVPFPYWGEIMSGFEYQAAVHMIYEGMIDEGLEVISAIRRRFDGRRRNPWNEHEAGHHYARAMASWAAILALSGLRYTAVSRRLELAPRRRPEDYRSIWTAGSGWGTVRQSIGDCEQTVRWEVLSGVLSVQEMVYATPPHAVVREVTVEVGSEIVAANFTLEAGRTTIALPRGIHVSGKGDLNVYMRIEKAE